MRYLNNRTCLSAIFCLAVVFGLSACGQNHHPIALTIVQPEGEGPSQSTRATLIDTIVKGGVPRSLAEISLGKFDEFRDQIHNTRYMSIVDHSQRSSELRFYLINMGTGEVNAIPVAHGSGSDPDRTGIAHYFSNRVGSKMSSTGAFIAKETYRSSTVGEAIRLDGLEKTNSRARERGIVLHAATYVSVGRQMQGRSWGCPAVPVNWIDRLLTVLPGGSFMYAYGSANLQTSMMDFDFLSRMVNPSHEWLNEGEDAPPDGEL